MLKSPKTNIFADELIGRFINHQKLRIKMTVFDKEKIGRCFMN